MKGLVPGRAGTVGVLLWPVFLASLGLTFVEFGLPIFGKSLGASALSIGGLYSVFTVTTLVARPLVGRMLDRRGRRPLLLAGLACMALAMGVFAAAGAVGGLYVARGLQGLAAALLWTSVNTIVADLSPAGELGRVMGRIDETSARSQIAGMFVALLVSLSLPDELIWPVVFAAFAVMAVVGTGVAYRRVPESRPQVLKRPSTSRLVSPQLLRLMVIVFTTGLAATMIAPIYLIYLQDKFTTDIVTLAWAYLPAGIVYSVAPSRLGRLSDRWGRAPLMAVGMAGAGLSALAMPHLPSLVWLIGLYTIAAMGWAMADPAEAALVGDLAGTDHRGRTYGTYMLAHGLGASIGPVLGGWLYDNIGNTVPFYLTGIILLLSALWALAALPARPTSTTSLDEPMSR